MADAINSWLPKTPKHYTAPCHRTPQWSGTTPVTDSPPPVSYTHLDVYKRQGHQGIGQVYGGDVVRAGMIMHGKTSRIRHEGKGVFAGLPDAYEATRYHSLVVDKATLPAALEITAWTENEDGSMEEIMGLRHREFPVAGVQFPPDFILTHHGPALLNKFLEP